MNWEVQTPAVGSRRGSIRLGNLHLNLDTYELRIGGEYVHLSHELWGYQDDTSQGRLAVLVHRLRYKLDRFYPYRVFSMRSRGYGLLPERPTARRPAGDTMHASMPRGV